MCKFHDAVSYLQLPEFVSFLLSYLNFLIPVNCGFRMSGKSQTIGDLAVPEWRPDGPIVCRYVGKIADHCRNLGRIKN